MSDHDNTPAPTAAQDPYFLEPPIGGIGVFSNTQTERVDGVDKPIGFVGTLIDHWNGFSVFTCTRAVAEAIVAAQDQVRTAYRAELASTAPTERSDTDIDTMLDQTISRMWIDGDAICTVELDPDYPPHHDSPDPEGLYVINGWCWCWEPVDPADCARVHGDLPDPNRRQTFVPLRHIPVRLPDRRLTVDYVHGDILAGRATSGVLRLDGAPVLDFDLIAGELTPTIDESRRDEFAAYLTACSIADQPATLTELVRALAIEHALDALIAQAADRDCHLLRLNTDVHDQPLHVRHTSRHTAHLRGTDLAALARTLPTPDGAQWEYWTPRGWRYLHRNQPQPGA